VLHCYTPSEGRTVGYLAGARLAAGGTNQKLEGPLAAGSALAAKLLVLTALAQFAVTASSNGDGLSIGGALEPRRRDLVKGVASNEPQGGRAG
jgi:hypothetical protein